MAASINSTASTIGGALAGINHHLTMNKAKMSIRIDNHFNAKVYTSKSTAAGHVTIDTGAKNIRFDHLQIVLLGHCKTRVDGSRATQKKKTTFLKMYMPVPESSYPVPRVYEADRTYTIPFNFVVPNALILDVCKHETNNDNVLKHHLNLPPSMGHWQKDDLAPDMVQVEYGIRAWIFRDRDVNGKRTKIMEAAQRINVLPMYPEQPPLSVSKRDKLYTMSKTKSVKKNIISPKIGELTVTAAQPAAILLSADGQTASSTDVSLNFYFCPVSSQAQPPKIYHIRSKITAATFFSLGPIGDTPNMGDWVKDFGIEGRGSYKNTVSLPDSNDKSISWSSHHYPQTRPDLEYGNEECTTLGTGAPAAPPINFTSSLQTRVQIPTHRKTFIPTFHSCIASRVYVLNISVVVSAGATNTSFKLSVPLQVAVKSALRGPMADPVPPNFEAAVEGPSAIEDWGELPGYGESR